jgi:hypothetical protein
MESAVAAMVPFCVVFKTQMIIRRITDTLQVSCAQLVGSSQLKQIWKLCNNQAPEAKKDNPNYNPAYKYDMIFQTIIHNTNAVTKHADLDQCADETFYLHEGYGKPT